MTTPCGAPNETVSVFTDAVAILDKFRNLVGAPLKALTDLEPSLPDLEIHITDVTYAIEAFSGEGYPLEPAEDHAVDGVCGVPAPPLVERGQRPTLSHS